MVFDVERHGNGPQHHAAVLPNGAVLEIDPAALTVPGAHCGSASRWPRRQLPWNPVNCLLRRLAGAPWKATLRRAG
ncbi:hypothetical protein [Acrocarpospora sp. B8E8]|uniref:hypothetical protein n=1 Tax=Acrocarpospora sp. B8E8 TaxID=3153572 RepID=UPI00325E041D